MRLPRPFYARPADEVARDLLGKVLCHRHPEGVQRVRVVETEAYMGQQDLACHASRGRTRRTEVMFGPPGHAYVYFIYGMHDMLNVVTARQGDPQAVLVRGAAPLEGIEGRTDGPGRLTRTMGITVAGHNGLDLCGDGLWFEDGAPPARIEATPRIGVDYAGTWAEEPLRFLDPDDPHVSMPSGKRSRRPRGSSAP